MLRNSFGLPVIENVNTPIAPYRSSAVVKYVYVSDYVRSVFGDPDERHMTVYPGPTSSFFPEEGKITRLATVWAWSIVSNATS